MLVDVFPWIETEKNDEMNKIKQIITNKEVLLADDSPSVIKTMQNILKKIGVAYKSLSMGRNCLIMFLPKGQMFLKLELSSQT